MRRYPISWLQIVSRRWWMLKSSCIDYLWAIERGNKLITYSKIEGKWRCSLIRLRMLLELHVKHKIRFLQFIAKRKLIKSMKTSSSINSFSSFPIRICNNNFGNEWLIPRTLKIHIQFLETNRLAWSETFLLCTDE